MSKGGAPSSKNSQRALAATTNEQLAASRPARNAYFSQLSSALKGDTGNIPIINEATYGSAQGQHQALAASRASIGRSGIGSQFGSGIEAGITSQGARNTNLTKEAIVSQFLGQAPNAALGAAQQGTAGLQTSAANQANIAAANTAAQQQLIGSGAAAGGAIAGAIIIAI